MVMYSKCSMRVMRLLPSSNRFWMPSYRWAHTASCTDSLVSTDSSLMISEFSGLRFQAVNFCRQFLNRFHEDGNQLAIAGFQALRIA